MKSEAAVFYLVQVFSSVSGQCSFILETPCFNRVQQQMLAPKVAKNGRDASSVVN